MVIFKGITTPGTTGEPARVLSVKSTDCMAGGQGGTADFRV
jgi:hypothetical protein